MRAWVGFLVGLALMAGLACSKQATRSEGVLSIEDLLIRDNEISGWTHAGSGWQARSVSELTVYINGLADLYQRHGFEEAGHQSYGGTINSAARTLNLTIYDLGSQDHAREVSADPDLGLSGATTWTDGAGQAAQYARYGGLSQVLTFYRGEYFVFLGVDEDTEESLNILKQFALNVDGKLQ